MPARSPLSAAEYQRLPEVVARVRESCGLDDGARGRCVYVASMSAADGPHATWGEVPMRPAERIGELLAAGCDVSRSMWDTGSLLVYLDIDHMDLVHPGEPYLRPALSFEKLEPVWRGTWEALDAFGLPMLDLMTGAGYGFVGRLALEGEAVSRLADLTDRPPAWLETHALRRPAWSEAWIGEREARAYLGLALVLEHLAHRVIAASAGRSPIPVVLGNTDVGEGPTGRECVSMDLTHMGDPLDARHLRVAFGAYQKHLLRRDIVGERASQLPPIAVVPRSRRPLADALAAGRDLERAALEAARADVRPPDLEAGMLRLLDDYAGSALASFHRGFLSPALPDAGSDAALLASLAPSALPPCVASCLTWPNDLLLKPAYLQNLVRTLMGRGWPARRIARLVLAHYRRPGLWGDHWRRIDPATRAFHDVRTFAGMVATGLDQGVDFNCTSTRQKRMCPGGPCGMDLRRERDRMLARRTP